MPRHPSAALPPLRSRLVTYRTSPRAPPQVAHLQACLFALVSIYLGDAGEPSWVATFRERERDAHGREVSPAGLYVAALYYSIMTLTSIGYGDIVPMNEAERLVCCFLMIISGATWAYVIGEAAGIAATLDPNTVAFRTSMDALNCFMSERQLDASMRHTLRDFFTDACAASSNRCVAA